MRTSWSTVIVTSLIFGLGGCRGCGEDALSSGHLGLVPAEARNVALIDLAGVAEDVRLLSPFKRFAGRWHELGDDLNDVLRARFGLALLDAEGAIAWGIDDDSWGAVLLGDFDAELPAEGPEISGHPAVDLENDAFAVVSEGHLIVGSRTGIERALAVLAGESASLDDAESPEAERLRDLLDDVGGDLMAMAAVRGDLDELLRPVAPDAHGVAASFSDRRLQLRVRLRSGDAASAAAAQLRSMMAMAVSELSDRAEAHRNDVDESADDVVWAIVAEHAAQLAADELVVIDDDGVDVLIELDMRDLGGGVGMMAALAGIAMPAFLDYIRRSRTSEARVNLQHLFEQARTYHATYGQFPRSVPRTPNHVPCGEAFDDWADSGWQALQFEIVEPFRFSYQFDAEGEGSWATFTASAFGDLDCDGDLSTFYLDGWIDSDGGVAGGEYVIDWSELE